MSIGKSITPPVFQSFSRKGGNFFWFDADSKLIFATDPQLAENFAAIIHADLPESGQQSYMGHIHVGEEDGESGLLVVRQAFEPWQLEIVFTLPDVELHGRLEALQLATTGAAAFILIASIVVISLLTHSFLHVPIVRLRDAAMRIGQRDFIDRIAIDSNDELGQLARQLEQMSTAISEYQQDQQVWYENLEQEVENRTSELRQAQHSLEDALRLNRAIIKGMMAGLHFAQAIGPDAIYARIHELAVDVIEPFTGGVANDV